MIRKWKPLVVIFFAVLALGCLEQEVDAATQVSSTSTMEQQLQEVLEQSRVDAGAAGAVLLVQTPSFHWVGASGLADRALNTPLRPTDMFRLASMTKTFVSVVVLKLCEEGKFQLDDPLREYLPASIVERLPFWEDITIRHLLSMTSGIYDYTDSDAYNDAVEAHPFRSPWSAEEILDYVYPEDAVFAPGMGWEYSNTNYLLLDMLVRAVSGTSLASEMRRTIHTPLGLRQTFMEIHERGAGGFGGLHVRGYDEEEDVTEVQDALGFGDGGLISDAQGVATFLQALFMEKTLLKAASLDQMRRVHPEEEYGLGVERRMTRFGEAWGHSGESSGFQDDMLYMPDRDLILVVLSNTMDTDICELVFQSTMEHLQRSLP